MVERLAPTSGSREKDLHLLPDRTLTNIFIKPARPNSPIYGVVGLLASICRHQSIGFNHALLSAARRSSFGTARNAQCQSNQFLATRIGRRIGAGNQLGGLC